MTVGKGTAGLAVYAAQTKAAARPDVTGRVFEYCVDRMRVGAVIGKRIVSDLAARGIETIKTAVTQPEPKYAV